jgi:hypothetical protein
MPLKQPEFYPTEDAVFERLKLLNPFTDFWNDFLYPVWNFDRLQNPLIVLLPEHQIMSFTPDICDINGKQGTYWPGTFCKVEFS